MKQNGRLFLTVILFVVLAFALSCLFACNDGRSEKSVYEIYKEAHPEYEGTEEEWMEEILGLSIGEQPMYTVTFKLNEADEEPYMTVSVNEGGIPFFPQDPPEKKGYEFKYWGYDGYEWPASYPITQDTVITAVWDKTVYNVTYHLDGGTNDILNPVKYTIEERATLTSPIKDYYVFDGWYTSDSFAEADKISEIKLGSTGDLNLYAHWTPVEYAIIYEGVDQATFEGDMVTSYTVETDNVRLPKAQKQHYEFLGWTTEGSTTPKSEYFIKPGGHGNVIYTANWKAVEYTITYDLDGGINNDENATIYTIEDFNDKDCVTLLQPSKNTREKIKKSEINHLNGMWNITASVVAFTFDYWEDADGNVIDGIRLGDGNVTVKAKWTESESADATREAPYLRDYDEDLIYIGLYPQRELKDETDAETITELNKLVSDEAVLAAGKDKNGIMYVDAVYNNKNYRKAMHIDNKSGLKGYVWYEFEAIPWSIVNISESGVALLSCKTTVGVSGYDGNGYWEGSRARAYLNSGTYNDDDYAGIGIYDQLFNDAQKALIRISSVDNTAKHEYEKNAGNKTEDKLFLFSFSEIVAYGQNKMGYYVNAYIYRTKYRDLGNDSLNFAFTRSLLSDSWNKGEKRLIIRRAAGYSDPSYSESKLDTAVTVLVPAMRIQLEDL